VVGEEWRRLGKREACCEATGEARGGSLAGVEVTGGGEIIGDGGRMCQKRAGGFFFDSWHACGEQTFLNSSVACQMLGVANVYRQPNSPLVIGLKKRQPNWISSCRFLVFGRQSPLSSRDPVGREKQSIAATGSCYC
jgi:hypothetical protein